MELLLTPTVVICGRGYHSPLLSTEYSRVPSLRPFLPAAAGWDGATWRKLNAELTKAAAAARSLTAKTVRRTAATAAAAAATWLASWHALFDAAHVRGGG